MLLHGRDRLGPIAHAYPAGSTLPDPATFQPIRNFPAVSTRVRNRPEGGLWCAPVSLRHPDGTPAATDWTDYCTADEYGRPTLHPSGAPYDTAVDIHPHDDARVYVIDNCDDLDRLVDLFPPPPAPAGLPEGFFRLVTPNWEAVADAGTDAVFVTRDGLRANTAEDRDLKHPRLDAWDSASVLWLRPAYRLGAQWPVRYQFPDRLPQT
ncbi:hypothetical protein [Kitasatospora sp. NPDC088346]|uniref:hypothetical protein n=1 Tax=Kitasatospora sp. NPDC088346 TaxID=3364073 RepID=UPI0038001082